MVGMQIAYGLKGFDSTTPKVSIEQIKFLCLASLKYVEADQIPLPVLVRMAKKQLKFPCLASL